MKASDRAATGARPRAWGQPPACPDDPVRVFYEHLARLGERYAVRIAREQRCPQLVFQFLDVLADRWLRARHSFSGTREGSFLNDGEKVLELQQIHDTFLTFAAT